VGVLRTVIGLGTWGVSVRQSLEGIRHKTHEGKMRRCVLGMFESSCTDGDGE
jgi:hypothetical protein